ncbi:MAG: hypothetical protein KUL83_01045 [Lentimicrobium sp.]|nr:hypothetical protein [Lentimicrobium sp.]MDD2529393.1 hypothetical protein [Lentimicrobiaceae bacterium]
MQRFITSLRFVLNDRHIAFSDKGDRGVRLPPSTNPLKVVYEFVIQSEAMNLFNLSGHF